MEQCTPTHAQAKRMRSLYQEGKLTSEVTAEQTDKVNVALGGITGGGLGKLLSGSTVARCTNDGTVTLSTDAINGFAGGILGVANGTTLKYCVNRGAVRATNVSSTSPHAFAGGIIGSDNETSGGAVVISGNVNEADIKAVTNSAAAKIGAGGLSGRLVMSDPAGIADNSVLSGSITCLSAGAAVSAADTGGPGAACGICELDGTWPITVGSSLTVEGKRYADVQSSVMSLSLWACPLNSGSITVTLQ